VEWAEYCGLISGGDMNLQDAAQILDFRELHFLPRVIFSIGTICFVSAFFLKLFILGLFGVGIIFIGSTLNLGIGVVMSRDISLKRKTFVVHWMLLCQFVLPFAITYALLVLAYHYYRYGEMPPYLQPLPIHVDLSR
jgi:hypothetical protein